MASRQRPTRPTPAAARKALSPRQARFVAEYLVDLNATQAAIRAGYSARTAASIGHEHLTKPEIAAAIAAGRAKVAKKLEISAERVIGEAWLTLIADPRELVECHVACCRHCWGRGHRYQRTTGEMERARADQASANKAKEPPFDHRGGVGFDARRDPNPACPECFGDGVGRIRVNDTRRLSPSAAALYAGVRQTRDGIEVKMNDRTAAAERLFRYLGLQDSVKAPPDTLHALQASLGKPLPDQARALIGAGLSGDLTLTQTSQLLAALGTLAKLIETNELEARITVLEQRRG